MSRLRTTSYVGDPRVKPPYGSVEVDWGHPLARGLKKYFAFDSPRVGTDLTKFSDATATGTRTLSPSAKGTAWSLASLTDYLTLNDAPFSTACTFTTIINPTANDRYLFFSNVDGIYWAIGTTATNKLQFFNGGWIASSRDVLDGAFHTASLTIGGGTGTLYVDGIADTSASLSVTGAGTFTPFRRGDIAGYDGLAVRYLIYNRVLTAAELLQQAFEPYALLRPIIRRRHFIFTPSVAAGGVFMQEHIGRGIGRGILAGR